MKPDVRLLAVAGVSYPFLVYAGLAVGLAVVVGRLLLVRGVAALAVWTAPLAAAAAGLAALAVANPPWAAMAYPVLMSLAACAAFSVTLIWPPSLVERLARRHEPQFGPRAQRYTRRVTMVWAVFLAGNAAISAATGRWGTLAQWTLWNGLLAYLLMGALFAGEWLLRRRLRRRVGAA